VSRRSGATSSRSGGTLRLASGSSPTTPQPIDDRADPARVRGGRAAAGPRAGYTFRPIPVRDAAEARACQDDLLTRLIRVWLANRGVWEAIVGAGPVVSVPATDEDVDAYLAAWSELLAVLAR
jgi:hypothetical protein